MSFSVIGWFFKGSDDSVDKFEIDFVIFVSGSAVIVFSMEVQFIRFVDFFCRLFNIKFILVFVVIFVDFVSFRE